MSITPEQLKSIINEAVSQMLAEHKDPKLTLSIAEAAELSGIGRDKITELTYREGFPCFKVGNRTLINKDMFIEWLNKITAEKLVI